MGGIRNTKHELWYVLLIMLLVPTNNVHCYQYKVGDLDAWGIPTSANPQVYTNWAKSHSFKIGDSLLFLYPPSQDSLIQVTEESYNACNPKDPILYMNNGNSLFNFTRTGDFYFTSGEKSHCEKHQKLHVLVPGVGSDGPTPPTLPDTAAAPSYPTVFGSIPMAPSSTPSSSIVKSPVFTFAAVIGLLVGLSISYRV